MNQQRVLLSSRSARHVEIRAVERNGGVYIHVQTNWENADGEMRPSGTALKIPRARVDEFIAALIAVNDAMNLESEVDDE